MKGVLLLCLLAFVGSGCCTANEFAVSLPDSFFSGIFNRFLFPLLDDYGALFSRHSPSECCYNKDSLGVKVRLTDLSETNLQTTSSVSSSYQGLQLTADVGFDLNFHFKICKQIGKICTPFLCNDNVTLQIALKFAALVNATANSNGKLVLSAPVASLVLDIPSYGHLCSVVRRIIADLVTVANEDLKVIFPKLLNDILGAVGDDLSTITNIENAQFQYLYSDSETGVSNSGLNVGGRIQVTNTKNEKQGTFFPSSTLPDLLSTPQPADEEELFIADSIPNNILQVLFNGTIPSDYDVVINVQGNQFGLRTHLKEAPQVSFSTQGNSVIVKTREIIRKSFIRVVAEVDIQFFFGFGHDENKIYLTLDPDNFVVDVKILPPVDPVFKNLTDLIDEIIEQQWQKHIPEVNGVLAQYAISFPLAPYFELPGTEGFDGYTRAYVKNKSPQNVKILNDVFSKLAATCPKIASMLSEMRQEVVTALAQKFLRMVRENLPGVFDDAKAETTIFQEERSGLMGAEKDDPRFYCPDIPGLSVDICPQ